MSVDQNLSVKAKVRETIESLPENASWDDVTHRLYVRQKIESGLKDVADGNILPVDEVPKRFGLPV